MATLALSLAGQTVGGFLGGPLGATIGRALGAVAGSAVDSALFNEPAQSSAGRDVRLSGSSQGSAVPRAYGWNRLSGNIIWATELERVDSATSGAKATTQTQSEDVIAANFALALCEGEVAHLGRIWADGEQLDTQALNIRFYPGSETQSVDPLIAAKQGEGTAPAYRGTCYLVFERLPLTAFGNRIPNITVEVCRRPKGLEDDIRAVTVIPGATEFGYDPTPRVRVLSPGVTEPENAHQMPAVSDWTLSIDELQSLCPNLEHVGLVVSWFGTDLRCDQCQIEPRVESAARSVTGSEWSVSSLTRADANTVSLVDGSPAYGGTPSDGSVLAAIADLKARGLKVTFYPFLLMDIQQGNGRDDPYGGSSEQPAYPWRGRITCDPAPGQVGSPDQTSSAATQVDAFIGNTVPADFSIVGGAVAYSGPNEFSFRRQILHYAHLCLAAGGVDAFVIGSEMRNLGFVRQSQTQFPFVDALVELATDVRTVLGAACKLTYAADWSEYHGYQPPNSPGDKLFHLDPLWAHSAIDAVGIDNYMPIADWRDGNTHLDKGGASSIYDLDYLVGNIGGGEGFDWYYASDEDRNAQLRTPIEDVAHGEHWVWRFKDIVGWWANAHHNRVGGVRAAMSTEWGPQSKPIWLTELGCGAVDKGANRPSAFTDAKSVENAAPYYSSGSPDELMQRQFLRAHVQHWNSAGAKFSESANPTSQVYAGRMVDFDRIYLWAWDARPYPQFPALTDVWSDGENYATGHWLAGRLGTPAPDEMIVQMADDFGVALSRVDVVGTGIDGAVSQGILSMRDVSEAYLLASDLNVRDGPSGLSVIPLNADEGLDIELSDISQAEGPLLERRWINPKEDVAQLGLNFSDRANVYQASSVTAIAENGELHKSFSSGLAMKHFAARSAAENILAGERRSGEIVRFRLPPSYAALEVGDVIRLADTTMPPIRISEIRDELDRQIEGYTLPRSAVRTTFTDQGQKVGGTGTPALALPTIKVAHLPPDPQTGGTTRFAAGAFAKPWPGVVTLAEAGSLRELARLDQNASLGVLATDLGVGQPDIWDRSSALQITLFGGHVASLPSDQVLGGANRLLVEGADGAWELVGFADAELIAARTYRLSGLLRGLDGTRIAAALTGGRLLLMNQSIAQGGWPESTIGQEMSLIGFSGSADTEGQNVSASSSLLEAAPLPPAHLKVQRLLNGDVQIGWIRRGRVNATNWNLTEIPLDPGGEAYRVRIGEGPNTLRTEDVTNSAFTYTIAMQTNDLGGPADELLIEVAQVSNTYGAGRPAYGTLNDGY